MKVTKFIKIVLFFGFVLFSFNSTLYSQTKVALIADNPTNLSDREEAVNTLLNDLEYTVESVSYSNATYSNLSNYLFTVAADNGAISSDVVSSLIENGQKVALLYDAGAVVGGTWGKNKYSFSIIAKMDAGAVVGGTWGYYYASRDDYRAMVVENGTAFLAGYESNVGFFVQLDNGYAYYIKSGYPYDWTCMGRNTRYDEYKTTFVREHTSGGRGVIWTYDPANYTGAGQNLFAGMTEWIGQAPPWNGVTVASGKVAFVIQGMDDATPTLTGRETVVTQQLNSLGYEITYLRFSRLSKSDLSAAQFVIGVEYPTIDGNTVSNLIENGQKVALLYDAGAVVGGTWGKNKYSFSIIAKMDAGAVVGGTWGYYYASRDDYRAMVVENGTGFLAGYESNVGFYVQLDNGYSYYLKSGYPSDWTCAGRNIQDDEYKTTFVREHTSGGRGVIWTYDPANYTGAGQNLFTILANWMSELPINEITVQEGNIAFIIRNDYNLLTDRESALKDKLESFFGYEITYIPFGKFSKSDVSNSQFVISTEYPTLNRNQIDSLLIEGEKIILLYNSGSVIGGTWYWDYSDYYCKSLYIEKNYAFLSDFSVNTELQIQSDNTYSYFVSDNYPEDWSCIGRNTSESNYKTAFYKISPGAGKGIVFTYNPEYFTSTGDQILQQQKEWLDIPSPLLTISGDISHTFDTTMVGSNPSEDNYTFEVKNDGSDVLRGDIISSATWLNINPSNIILAANESQIITVTAQTKYLNTGVYSDSLKIITDGGKKTGMVKVVIHKAVGIEEYNVSPEEFALHQNYPNPFNPTTTISYDLPKSSYVCLSIYDINGKLINSLVNEQKSAGSYSVIWNASNISSGLYFYRIQADDFNQVKKCLLLK